MTGLELLAVVEQVGLVVNDAAESVLTKPRYAGVMVGAVPP
jgi:hypothetical protein